MQNNPSPKPQVVPPQIPEEAATTASWSSDSASSDLDSANEYELYDDDNGIAKDFASEDRDSYISDDFAEPCTAEYFHVKPLRIVSVSRDSDRRTSIAVVSPGDIGQPRDYVIRIEPPSDTPMPQIQEEHQEFPTQHRTIRPAYRGSLSHRDSTSSCPASLGRRASQADSTDTPLSVPDNVTQPPEQSPGPPSQEECQEQNTQIPSSNKSLPEEMVNQHPDVSSPQSGQGVSEVKGEPSSAPRISPESTDKEEKPPQQGLRQPTGTPDTAIPSDLKMPTLVTARSTSPYSTVSSLSNSPAPFTFKPPKPPRTIPYTSQADIALQLQSCYASLPVAPAQSSNTTFLRKNPGSHGGRRGPSSPRYAATLPAGGKAQAYQAAVSSPLGSGKKKTKFAMFSALFSRKRNRDKAQKASQPSCAAPSPTPQRTTIKPQPCKPKQLTLTYPPGQAPRAPVPKKQRTDPHTTHLQLEMPLVPQSARNPPPRKCASPKPSQPAPSQQPSTAQQPESSSAYLTTKQIANEEKAQHTYSETPDRSTLLSVPKSSPGTAKLLGGEEERPAEYRQFSWATNAEETITIKKNRRSVDEQAQAAHALALAARLREEQQYLEEQAQEDGEESQLEDDEGQENGRWLEERQKEERRKEERREKRRHEERQGEQQKDGQPEKLQQEEQEQQEQQPQDEESYRQQLLLQQDPHGAASTQLQQGRYSVDEHDGPITGQGPRNLQEQHSQQMPQSNQLPLLQKPRSVSGPTPLASTKGTMTKRHVSSPLSEPQYDAPPIPAAYNYVSGAFVSGNEQVPNPVFSPRPDPAAQFNNLDGGRPYPPSQIPAPLVGPSYGLTNVNANTLSAISPISCSPDPIRTSTQLDQGFQPQQLSPISEVNHNDRSWLFDIPEGATEQEIVRTRQRQYMAAKFASHQQLHAERAMQSSSRLASASPISPNQAQGGGLLIQPQPYPNEQPVAIYTQDRRLSGLSPMQHGASAYPAADSLPPTPDLMDNGGPVQPMANTVAPPLPPKLPLIPTSPFFSPSFRLSNSYSHQSGQAHPDSLLPSTTTRPPSPDTRSRQLSIALLQHPQPASMAASPHPSTANMGAASLRHQLLRQEEQDRLQRFRRLQSARLDPQHEDRNREAARERARELERSVAAASAGSSSTGSGYYWAGTPTGFARLLHGTSSSTSSPTTMTTTTTTPTTPALPYGAFSSTVFELPAHGAHDDDDDELVMRATSYPGQEWVPTVWED